MSIYSQFRRRKSNSIYIRPSQCFRIHFTLDRSGILSKQAALWRWLSLSTQNLCRGHFIIHEVCVLDLYPTLAREFQGFRVWGTFVFRTLELTDTPTNLANLVKVGHALDQSRSVQSRGPERAHQNNEPSWRSSRTDRRLSRQFWDD